MGPGTPSSVLSPAKHQPLLGRRSPRQTVSRLSVARAHHSVARAHHSVACAHHSVACAHHSVACAGAKPLLKYPPPEWGLVMEPQPTQRPTHTTRHNQHPLKGPEMGGRLRVHPLYFAPRSTVRVQRRVVWAGWSRAHGAARVWVRAREPPKTTEDGRAASPQGT